MTGVEKKGEPVAEHEVRQIGSHRVQIQRKLKGQGSKQHMTRAFAWCSCSWSSPIVENNEQLDKAIHSEEHFHVD